MTLIRRLDASITLARAYIIAGVILAASILRFIAFGG